MQTAIAECNVPNAVTLQAIHIHATALCDILYSTSEILYLLTDNDVWS